MKTYRLKVTNRKHFNSLIKAYRNNGFMIVTYGNKLAELENTVTNDFIVIEY